MKGQCKIDFEEWYCEMIFKEFIDNSSEPEFNGEEIAESLWVIPDSMQFGLIKDFAYSKGWFLNMETINYLHDKDTNRTLTLTDISIMQPNDHQSVYWETEIRTLEEARKLLVDNFNTLYNE